jgi:hypothetical protein
MGQSDRTSLLKLLGMGAAGLGPSGVVGRRLLEPAGGASSTGPPGRRGRRQLTGPLTTRLRPAQPREEPVPCPPST